MPTIYLTEQGSVVHRTDERLVVTKEKKVIADVPIIKVEQLVVMGNVQLTTQAVAFLLQSGVDVVFLSSYGKFRGRLTSTGSKFAELRHRQLRKLDDEKATLKLAKQIVIGKLTNQRTVMQRQARDSSSAAAQAKTSAAVRGIAALLQNVKKAKSVEAVRGFEGKAGALYFSAFKALLSSGMGFKGRNYHPPQDPVNSLLSFGYTLLLKDITAAVQLVGLDPYLGFFHAIDYGRPSLALDMMEEFRPTIVDSIVLNVVNNGILSEKDFIRTKRAKRPVLMTDEGRKRFIEEYEGKVNTTVTYPLTGEKTSYRRCFELQVRQLARCITGKRREYKPMTIK